MQATTDSQFDLRSALRGQEFARKAVKQLLPLGRNKRLVHFWRCMVCRMPRNRAATTICFKCHAVKDSILRMLNHTEAKQILFGQLLAEEVALAVIN